MINTNFVSILSSAASLISSVTALYISLHNPRTKLGISLYKTNFSGLEQINALSQVHVYLRFCLLSKGVGTFSLIKVIYIHEPLMIHNHKLVSEKKFVQLYGLKNHKMIDKLPSTKIFEKLKSLIVVSSYNPVIELNFTFSELYSLMNDHDIGDFVSDPNVSHGELLLYFKTNDRYHRYIKVIVNGQKYKNIYNNVSYHYFSPC